MDNVEEDENVPLIFEENDKSDRILRLKLFSLLHAFLTLALLTSTVVVTYLYYYQQQMSSAECPNSSLSLLGVYSKTAVAADNVFCSEIGRNILLRGGNAVDAAVAALFCIGVMDAHSAGMGGGHFMTIYNSHFRLTTKKCYAIDARETAPIAASENMFVGKWNLSQKGWLSIAVPGELHGAWTAYQQFGGGIEWKRLLDPTIHLLKEGYPASHALTKALKDEEKWILKEPTMKMFLNPKTGKLYEAGEQIVTRKNFMQLLQKLALSEDPVQLFYNSSLTREIVTEFEKNGGILKYQDFATYKSKVYDDDYLIHTELQNGYEICGPPPPSGSAIAQAILKVFDEYSTKEKLSRIDPEILLHRFIEASKFAYAARSELGDITFNITTLKLAKYITSSEHAMKIRKLITDKAHPQSYYGGNFEPINDHGTTHISVVDSQGNAVSVTSTINLLFGSGVSSESTGIIWNDEMDDFSSPGQPNYFGFLPSKANFIQPRKRPMSSASPLIIYNRKNTKELFVVGAAGGSRIISGVASVALRFLWLNENAKEAIDAVRIHNQLTPNITFYEDGLSMKIRKALAKRGHIMAQQSNLSVVTAVERKDGGVLYANSDYRKGFESSPAGF